MFGVPAAAGEVVDDGDFVAAGREAERSRPAEVAVAPKDEDSHEGGTLDARAARGTDASVVESGRWRADWRRETGAGWASPRWSRSCCSGLGLRVGEAWDGRAPVYDAQAYAAIAANLEGGEGSRSGARATQPSSNYSPGLPLFVAGLYEVDGRGARTAGAGGAGGDRGAGVLFAYRSERLAARRRQNRDAGVPTRECRRFASALNLGRRCWGAGGGDLPGAAGVPGDADERAAGGDAAVGRGAGGALGLGRAGWARWLLPGALFGALALMRPEYLGGRRAGRGRRLRLATAASDWRAVPRYRAAVLLAAARWSSIAPWTIRNAVALDRFVPISTGGGQVLFAGTYLPSDGDPEKVGAEVVAENPELFAPQDAQRLRLEQILARLAAAALSRDGNRQGALEDGQGTALGRRLRRAARIRRLRRHQGRPDLVARAARRDARAGLGGPALGAGRPRPARARRCSPGGGAGRRCCSATIFLAITAISALLVASPRRVLVMLPLSPLAGSARPGSASSPGEQDVGLASGESPNPTQSWSYLTVEARLDEVAVSAPLKAHVVTTSGRSTDVGAQ